MSLHPCTSVRRPWFRLAPVFEAVSSESSPARPVPRVRPDIGSGTSWCPGRGACGAPEADVITAPVEIDGDVLFRIRGVSSLPASDRAQRIRERIIAVARDPAVAPESLQVVNMESASYLQAGNESLMAVIDADASLEQVGRAVLAQAHLLRIQQAIRAYRAERTPQAVQDDVLKSLLATIGLCLAILAIVWAGRLVDTALSRRLRSRIQSVGIQSFEVVRAKSCGTRCAAH